MPVGTGWQGDYPGYWTAWTLARSQSRIHRILLSIEPQLPPDGNNQTCKWCLTRRTRVEVLTLHIHTWNHGIISLSLMTQGGHPCKRQNCAQGWPGGLFCASPNNKMARPYFDFQVWIWRVKHRLLHVWKPQKWSCSVNISCADMLRCWHQRGNLESLAQTEALSTSVTGARPPCTLAVAALHFNNTEFSNVG